MADRTKTRSEGLYEEAVKALNRHEDPFSPQWRQAHQVEDDEMGFLMDVIGARIAYGEQWIRKGMVGDAW